jgi:hypothetical protein
MGGAGDPPAPVGDPPTGMSEVAAGCGRARPSVRRVAGRNGLVARATQNRILRKALSRLYSEEKTLFDRINRIDRMNTQILIK